MLTMEDKKWIVKALKCVVWLVAHAYRGANWAYLEGHIKDLDDMVPKPVGPVDVNLPESHRQFLILSRFCDDMGVKLDITAESHNQAVAQFLKSMRR
jgi:hypothetical protein